MIKSLANIIGNGKQYLTKKIILDKETVLFIFKEVVQENFGIIGLKRLLPNCFSDGVLFVQVQNLNWVAEFEANKMEIIQKMNRKIGTDFIKEIRIK
jgi:predicted nucleic acid-binding Zn ribbon protein